MKTIKRDEAIEKLVEDELRIWVLKFQENDLSYFEDIIKNGIMLLGFKHLDNEDLEEEYYEKFDEEVEIK